DGHNDGKWDQFAANEQKYGVSSTFNEEYYTTPLDKSSIPAEKREEADQIARQIEAGQTHAEVEDRVDVDGDGDEEARFGAAAPLANTGNRAFNSNRPLPQVPERPGQELANAQDRSGRKGMISEMKRINALNLEPTSAKHDDSNVRGGRGLKDPAQRNPQRMSGNNADLKSEFQQSLQVISQQEAKRNRKAAGDGEMGPWEGNNTQASGDKSKNQPGALAKAGDPSRQGFSFNPKAPAFSLNPQAGEFMPGGSNNAAANPAPANAPAKSTGPGPMLKLDKKSTK
ncbi:CID4, partial [Symbiodinium sp. CCMP2456]